MEVVQDFILNAIIFCEGNGKKKQNLLGKILPVDLITFIYFTFSTCELLYDITLNFKVA